MINLFAGGRLAIDPKHVFRALGYPGPDRVSEPVREICLAELGRLDCLITPWAGSYEVRIERIDTDVIRLDGGRALKSARLSKILRQASALQICLATVGPEVTAEVERLTAEGSMVEALALDAAATAAVTELMGMLREHTCAEAGKRQYGATLRYGPGYTGWCLEDTAVLFSYLDGERLPVRLNQQLVMLPAKSLLNVIGLVPGGHAAAEVLSCRLCDLLGCGLRRAPAQTGA